MAKTRRSAVETLDGMLELPTKPVIGYNEDFGAPELKGHMVIDELWHNPDIALAQELSKQGLLQVIGKSGGSRVGLHVLLRKDEEPDFDHRGGRIVMPVGVLSLRAVPVRQNGIRDDLLSVVMDMSSERKVPIGRLVLAHPKDALSRDQIIEAIRKCELALPSNCKIDECVDGDSLLLSLQDLHVAFCEKNFRTEQKRNVVRYGKHALYGIQEEREGLQPEIDGKEFFVGGIHISIGPYIAVIDEETNEPGVVHLAARVLDGIRTTGLNVVRHVELFNKLYEAVSTGKLKIRIRLYHANKDMQRVAKRVINKRTIHEGVSFADIIDLEKNPERILDLMRLVQPTVADGNPAGYFVGPGKSHKVQWVDNASANFQDFHLEETAPKFSAGDPSYCVRGDELPQPVAELARLLGYVGQDQSHSKMYAQCGFPDSDTMRAMRMAGVGVFVAHDLRQSAATYKAEKPTLSRKRTLKTRGADGQIIERSPVNDVFFDDQLFGSFKKLHAEGTRFLLVRHEMPDAFHETDMLPEEVLEWDKRGVWVKPGSLESIEKVDTLIAMYGSHVKGMDKILRPQLSRFALRMKRLFGETMGFIHGKGPGVMHIADFVARHLPELAKEDGNFDDIQTPITSWGVGIDLEQQNQEMNFHPDAQIDFGAQNRLVRQKHMNDRAVFNNNQ